MKLIELLPILDRSFDKNKAIQAYTDVMGERKLAAEIYEFGMSFPMGMPDQFLNAKVLRVHNGDRTVIDLESND